MGNDNMTAKMEILGWRAERLRCPDHTIDLTTDNGLPHKVSLIQMPNGTGKTTTLKLLRAALSGSNNWESDEIREFAKKDGNNDKGEFEVKLSLNNKLFTVLLEFDFVDGALIYKTTSGHGQRTGFEPPLDFKRFMKAEFINFFVFDGELAQNLLDKNHTDAEKVVEILFQVDLLRKISEKVEYYWNHKTKGASATEERGLTRRKNDVKRLRERLSELQNRQQSLEKELSELETQISQSEREYKSEIEKTKELNEKHMIAKEKYESTKLELENYARQVVLETMANPHALSIEFSSEMLELKEGLDRVKLPESAAREFFIELADETVCVCGRAIDEQTKMLILERAEDYLASDEMSFLNSMKSSIDEAINVETNVTPADLDNQLSELKEIVAKAHNSKADLDFILDEINQADPEAARISQELASLKERKAEVQDELRILEEDSDEISKDSKSIKVIKKLLMEAEEKLEEITNTIDLRKKRDLLTAILDQAYINARAGISQDICKTANQKVEELMPNNNIRIERIDQCLVLKGQSGGSAGEQLSIAYAFLSTLFSRSEHKLPFVVDSPAGPIDLNIRPKIGNLIPRLTDQFIAFTISSEREGFVPALKKANSHSIQFLTVFKSGNAELEKAARKEKDKMQTKDGYVVTGEEFFNAFQVDKE